MKEAVTAGTAKPGTAKPERFEMLPVKDLIPTPDNSRVVDEEADEFKALVESVKAQGVRVPVHVRAHPAKPGKWDLRAGARRLRAAILAGLKEIPAIVHDAMSDDEALSLTFQENFDREALRALEEGEIVSRLLEEAKGDVEAVGKRLGRKYTWIAQRARIHRGLSDAWKKAVKRIGGAFESWSARHLALVARLPQGVQEQLLRELAMRYNIPEVRLEDLNRIVVELLRPLSKAQWDGSDETLLPKAGACAKCPKRSAAEPLLWEDDGDAAAPGKKNDRCLDAACWDLKSFAGVKRAVAAAKKQGDVLLVESERGAPSLEREAAAKAFGTPVPPYEYRRVPEGTKGAVPAIVVCGSDRGATFSALLQRESQPRLAQKTLEEKRQALTNRRWAEVVSRISDRVIAAAIQDVISMNAPATVMALAAAFGCGSFSGCGEWSDFDAVMRKPKATAAALWQVVRRRLADRLQWTGPASSFPKYTVENAKRVARLIGIDVDALYREVSKEKGFGEPKSWAAEGTKSRGTKSPAEAKAAAKRTKKPAKENCGSKCGAIGTEAQCKDCGFSKKPKKEKAA